MHPGLAWLRQTADGRAWLERLPDIVATCERRWSLRIREPYDDAFESLVLPADLPDGTRAVLKVPFPGREVERQADALEAWDGDGAVRLLARDDDRGAMLLERCEPGTPLTAVGRDAALDVLVELLPRLWRPAGPPFRPLVEEAAWWTETLPREYAKAGEPFERELFEAALATLEELPATQGEQVLVNQDLHADNVLRAERQPWLVIDPKPLTGEREFGVVAIVRGHELGDTRDDMLVRLDRLSSALGLDRDRVRLWTLAHTLAWGFDDETGEAFPDHVDRARWLLSM